MEIPLSPHGPSLARLRAEFPGLESPTLLLDNAGGSQVPRSVIAAIADYFQRSYVQTGAGYDVSNRASATVDAAHAWIERLVGADGVGRAILGPSSTQLCHMLAACYRRVLRPGDEIVIAESGHEANIGAWLALAEGGVRIRWWHCEEEPTGCPLESLDSLLGERTRLVCFPHVSNLLGGVIDVAEVTRRVHAAGAKVVVDGVAFAPHRPIDLRAWRCDWYVYSTYKVYGPHMGALIGTHEAIDELAGPNHFFIPKSRVPYTFELGGACHEGCAGLLGLQPYLRLLAQGTSPGPAGAAPSELLEREIAVQAFARMSQMELPLQARLVAGLLAIPGLRLIGPASAGVERVPTVSVVHPRVSSKAIVAEAHRRGVGFRHGHMYSYRLLEAMGIAPEDGVVRISAVHYSTPEEIDCAVEAVDAAIHTSPRV